MIVRQGAPAPRATPPLLVFLVILAVCGVSILKARQLGDFWNPDEWYLLGANLAVHGTLGFGDEATVHRPPGYPFFVAAVLRAAVPLPTEIDEGFLRRSRSALYLAQSLVLASGAAVLCLWLGGAMGEWRSAVVAVLFGANPYLLVLVGLPHYALLHVFFLIVCSYLTQRTVERSCGAGRLAFTGVAWGLATLVRPVTLLLPPFLLILYWRRRASARDALRSWLLVTAGMVFVIAPWTVRNWLLTGRLVPVHAQAWTALWAATAEDLPSAPNHYKWQSLAERLYLPLYSRETGEAGFSFRTYARNVLHLEDVFRAAALENLRRQPEVYARNALRGFWTYHADLNAVMLKLFLHVQRRGAALDRRWFQPGDPQDFESSRESAALALLFRLWLALALGGAVLLLAGRAPFLLVPGLVHACFAVAHTATYMDFFYYYAKVPFLFVFAAVFLQWAERIRVGSGRLRLGLGTLALGALAALTLWLLLAPLWGRPPGLPS